MTSTKSVFRAGDVLYGKLRPYLSKVCLPDFDGVCSTDILVYPRSGAIDNRFLHKLLLTSRAREFAQQSSAGINLPRVSAAALAQLPLALPPLAEQLRIVQRLELSETRSGKAREALDAIPPLLEQFRRSVLAAAFRGDLTADWRTEHPNVEPASVLLDEIRAARRRRWGQLRPGKRYQEPVVAAVERLPALPRGWTWATIDELAESLDYGTSAKTTDNAAGIPVLRMGNVVAGQLDMNELRYLPPDHGEFPRLLLKEGDILFNRTNSAELVGKSAVYAGAPTPCSFASYLIRVRLIDCEPYLVSAYINSPAGRAWITSVASQQVGQANVNGTKLRSLAVPLPPRAEQKVLWERLSHVLMGIERVREQIAEAESQLHSQEQSVLAKAFRGELVPQDPNDEPASVLLERIRGERASAPRKPRRTGARSRK